MKVLIDACVLFPTVLRGLVLGAAESGAFQPLWSARILEEWQRAGERFGPRDGEIARGEIALAQARFPQASVAVKPETEAGLRLPDADDLHVLAAAIDGGAGELLTLNVKDFPTNALAAHGILRRHPDEFLLEVFHGDPQAMGALIEGVLAQVGAHGIDVSNPRALLKRARVPRLGKAFAQL
ncbi:MAG: PIN domain-containing protein [Silicimonas sp.]|nr:PIN domain-containing protein [Silicimonas sp.]